MTQYDIIGKLLRRKKGATSFEMTIAARTTSIFKRMQEMREHGWTITKKPVPGKNYHTFYGVPNE